MATDSFRQGIVLGPTGSKRFLAIYNAEPSNLGPGKPTIKMAHADDFAAMAEKVRRVLGK